MPTVQPFRNCYQLKATDIVWWSDSATHGSWIEHNSEKLILTSSGATLLTKVAMKFDLPSSYPAWITRGPIASKQMGIGVKIINPGSNNGTTVVLKAAPITSAWSPSSTLTQMRAITTGASINLGSFDTRHDGIDILHTPSTETNMIVPDANGIMFYISTTYGGIVVLSSEPTIVLRYYYQYTPGGSIVDATVRTDLSSKVLSILRGNSEYRRVVIAVNGLKEETRPAEDNASIKILAGRGSGISRKLNYPTPWNAAQYSPGALSASSNDKTELERASEAPLETVVSLIDSSGTSYELAKQRQLARSITDSNDGTGEIALSSPIQAAMARAVTLWDPQGQLSQGQPGAVEFSDVEISYLLNSLILNVSLIPFKYYYYKDIYGLRIRFKTVWDRQTLSTSDVEGLSVGDLWSMYAPMLGLHITEMGDGCLSVFHPAVRRGSLRIFYLKSDRTLRSSLQITEKSRTEAFSSVDVSRSSGSASSNVFPSDKIVMNEDWKENSSQITAYGETFYSANSSGTGYDFEIARKGLGRQLAQLLCGVVLEIKGVLGFEFITLNCGDQLLIDVPGRDLFLAMVTEVTLNPNTLRSSFTALHNVSYSGLHSVFTQDDVLGLWRAEDDNEISGGDNDWVETSAMETILYAHWQGALIGGFLYTNTDSLLNDVSAFSDTFDLAMGGLWELGYDDQPLHTTCLPSWWNDDQVVPFIMWRKSSGDEALVWGMRRPGYSSGDVQSNTFSLIHYTVMQSSGFAGATYFDAPPGIIGTLTSASPERDFVTAGVAFAWRDTSIRLYLDRKLILEASDATIFDKSVWDNTFWHGSEGGPYVGSGGTKGMTQTMMASLTHIGKDGWIENLQRLNEKNGIDVFYGPDELADLIET